MKPRVWIVLDADEESGHIVVARTAVEAMALYDAVAGPERAASATLASWQRLAADEPALPDEGRIIGLWVLPDHTLAGYDLEPEGYQRCGCCDLVLPEDDFAEDSDGACQECADPSEAP